MGRDREEERERERVTEGDREEYMYMNIVRETDGRTDKKNSGEDECERKEKMSILLAAKIS